MRIKFHKVCKEFERNAWQMLGTKVGAKSLLPVLLYYTEHILLPKTTAVFDTMSAFLWITELISLFLMAPLFHMHSQEPILLYYDLNKNINSMEVP